jgi:hypothetical protein
MLADSSLRFFARVSVAALIGLLASTASQSAIALVAEPTCTFPSTTDACRSPDGRWVLRWQEATASTPHVLFAERRGNDRSVRLLTFNRSITVLWSPDSTYAAITDRSGSSESGVLVAELSSGTVTNAEDEMHRTLKSQPPIYANGHRYFSARRWKSNTQLTFEVWAYDAVPGTDVRATFVFDVKTKQVTEN